MKKILLVLLIALSSPIILSAQSNDFKIVKSTDTYFSILRELLMYYVDSVNVEKLVNTSVEAMLNNLDPYTEFVSEEQSEAFDFMITGAYGGMGSLIRKTDKGIQITDPYKGFPADKAGLVPGDCIIEIDGVSTKNMDATEGSNKLKGVPGSKLQMKVVKIKTGDTVDIQITRVRIHISDVSYSGMLRDSTGYIMLSAFTKDGSKDFADAFQALKKTNKMKSLIIDLRSNGGGSLDEAVNILSMFVPKGTKVVEARGRLKEFEIVYKTKDNPVDLEIPIVVLVNSISASAAEIIAGSIQDLDRGVVVGTRTFGKGLVQSVRDLNFNTKLKITTAKYYIPSGRCIQIVDYSHRKEDGSVGNIPDSLISAFTTSNGRIVYDGGGIIPDINVELSAYPKIAYSLFERDLIRPYALEYFVKHQAIAPPETFRLTDNEYNDFVEYLMDKNFNDKIDSQLLFERFIETAKNDKLYDALQTEIDELQQKIATDKRADLMRFRTEIQRLLEEEICTIYYYQEGRVQSAIQRDQQVDKAVEILTSREEYRKVLTAVP
ncbi:MAG: S41 family peptidase [Prevotellaceae bacterium]|jgi:carboxyl-terminal processing protease|nr:S41 family peptidase [Prevotellaceae bacterium]